MKNDMNIRLNEEISEIVKGLAESQGLTEDAVVQMIIKWYVNDCTKEN